MANFLNEIAKFRIEFFITFFMLLVMKYLFFSQFQNIFMLTNWKSTVVRIPKMSFSNSPFLCPEMANFLNEIAKFRIEFFVTFFDVTCHEILIFLTISKYMYANKLKIHGSQDSQNVFFKQSIFMSRNCQI